MKVTHILFVLSGILSPSLITIGFLLLPAVVLSIKRFKKPLSLLTVKLVLTLDGKNPTTKYVSPFGLTIVLPNTCSRAVLMVSIVTSGPKSKIPSFALKVGSVVSSIIFSHSIAVLVGIKIGTLSPCLSFGLISTARSTTSSGNASSSPSLVTRLPVRSTTSPPYFFKPSFKISFSLTQLSLHSVISSI